MSGESMHDVDASTVPKTATEQLNLAERFSSFADYAASTASLPQKAATSLDVARFHAFTGQMTFSIDPAVILYLDGGVVYHAERQNDPSVSRQLLDAGVLDPVQLQRGGVRVGDVEHLGRLFDRDTTVDRDAVMVIVEAATEAIVSQIANSVIATVTASAYRHHPSGIHRWFVAPVEPTSAQRPAGGVAQIDRSVVDELPSLGTPTPAADTTPMVIEWSDPDPAGPGLPAPLPSPAPDAGAPEIDIQAELDRFDADRADWSAASGGDNPDGTESISSPLGEFRIVWPDGTADESIVPSDLFDEASSTAPPAPGAAPDDDREPLAAPVSIVLPELAPPSGDATVGGKTLRAPSAAPIDPVPAPKPTETPSGPLGFTLAPLQVDRIPEPDAAVPDDVAAAVRRALQAIENASTQQTSASVPEMQLAPVTLPKLSMPSVSAPTTSTPALSTPAVSTPALSTQTRTPSDAEVPAPAPKAESIVAPASPAAPAAPLGFAPPTMDMRAEAVYERAAAQVQSQSAEAQASIGGTTPSLPEPGQASVVFVDEDPNRGERSGALRRLIGNLRGKDD